MRYETRAGVTDEEKNAAKYPNDMLPLLLNVPISLCCLCRRKPKLVGIGGYLVRKKWGVKPNNSNMDILA